MKPPPLGSVAFRFFQQFRRPHPQQLPVAIGHLLQDAPPALVIFQVLPGYSNHVGRQENLFRLASPVRYDKVVSGTMPPRLHAVAIGFPAAAIASQEAAADHFFQRRKFGNQSLAILHQFALSIQHFNLFSPVLRAPGSGLQSQRQGVFG